jgi:hypothetical protein
VTADPQAEVARWLSGLEPSVREGVEVLAKIVTSADARMEQAIKWRQLTFTVGGNWHHWVCAIAATKKATKLVLHKGALLGDPHALLEGSGRYLREIPLERARENPDAVREIVRSAVDHQTDMLP